MKYGRKLHFLRQIDSVKWKSAKFRLHPLIHTVLGFAHAQDVEKEKSGVKNSAF
jgi:hypothetical protein